VQCWKFNAICNTNRYTDCDHDTHTHGHGNNDGDSYKVTYTANGSYFNSTWWFTNNSANNCCADYCWSNQHFYAAATHPNACHAGANQYPYKHGNGHQYCDCNEHDTTAELQQQWPLGD